MKFAILADIHGNKIALDAVLRDIEAQGGVDVYWVLGDLVALGPQPNEVLVRLSELDNVLYVRGNTDRYVVRRERPYPSQQDVLADVSLLPRIIEVADGFSWTQGMITAGGWYDFLANLPFEQRMTLPNGDRVLGIHSEPNNDDGFGVRPDVSDASLAQTFSNCDADLIFVGHTHWPAKRTIGSMTIVNTGSVSNPRIPSLQATYVLLETTPQNVQINHRFVEYDRHKVIEIMNARHYSAADFVAKNLTGAFVKDDWKIEI